MKEAPWGIGLGMDVSKIPPHNKYHTLSMIPPDSEYVYIWVHAGPIGVVVFVITTILLFGGACYITLFRLKSQSLRGYGAGLCSAFVALHLGGYANQILMQFPNIFLFYGGMSILYNMPYFEQKYLEYEEKILAGNEEKKRLKEEKKRGSEV